MKTDLKTKIEKIYSIVLVIIFIASLVYNLSLILTKMDPYFIESDLINEITYRQQCYMHKTLFPDNYMHSNELFATRPVLLYCFFYNITHNFLLSYQMEVAVMLVVQLLVTAFLCKCLELKKNSIVFVLNIFLIWMPPLIKNVLWLEHDAYSLFAIAVFLTFVFRIFWRRGKHKIFSVSVCIAISAFMGILTLKMSLILYIPLLLSDLMILIADYRKENLLNKQNAQLTIMSIGLLVINLIFYKVCLTLFDGKFIPVKMRMADINTMFSWNNMLTRLVEVAGSFGIHTTGGEILSGKNILFMLYGFVFIGIIAVTSSLMKKYCMKEGTRLELVLFVINVLLLNFGLLFVLAWQSPSYRYYFSAILFIPLLLGIWIDNLQQKVITSVIVAGSLILFGGSYIVYYNETFLQMEFPLLEVARYIEEKGYSYVAASYWNAATIKGYLNGKVETAHAAVGSNALLPYIWMTDKNVFSQSQQGKTYALVLTEEEYWNMTNSFTQILMNKYSSESMRIGSYYIFTYTENPYVLMDKIKEIYNAGLPLSEQNYKIVYPDNSDLSYNRAELDRSNVLVSDGKQTTYIMSGPSTDTISGNYNITLNYSVEYLNGADTEEQPVFDVALDSQTYRSIICEKDKKSVTLKDVNIDEGHKFEVRVLAPKGTSVHIFSVEYERLN